MTPTGFVIVGPSTGESAIKALPIRDGWSEPARSANGLIAFGVWDVLAEGFDTRILASQVAGLSIYDYGDDWRLKSGWVEAKP